MVWGASQGKNLKLLTPELDLATQLWQQHLHEAGGFALKNEPPPSRATDLRFDENICIVWEHGKPSRLRYVRFQHDQAKRSKTNVSLVASPSPVDLASAPGSIFVEYDLQKKAFSIVDPGTKEKDEKPNEADAGNGQEPRLIRNVRQRQ